MLDLEDLGESSDDSDFRIEDHDVADSDFSGGSSASESMDEGEDSETDQSLDGKPIETKKNNGDLSNEPLTDAAEISDEVIKHVFICCVCLGDRSDDSNEIVECDGCNITVHEACCGVQDTASVSSTVSSCSTEPWFCEACRAGVTNPICELCPNFGGIFKETDVGKWVHLVCALYVQQIAFNEPDKLSSVTLFDISSSKWGNKDCQLCQDSRFSRTGMTIECDAAMCRTYFHVTCGQREGLLSEATSEEVEQADPFYAHCKLHSDKTAIKQRKRNWLALQLRLKKMAEFRGTEVAQESSCWKRNQRKLSKYRGKYSQLKLCKQIPWVPSQKRPRLITTSASACRILWRKSELMGIDVSSFEKTESLLGALQDVPKKWHIPPALSVEFIGYFLDRDSRVNRLKNQLSDHAQTKARLSGEQLKLQKSYDTAHSENLRANQMHISMKNTITFYHDIINMFRPKAKLPDVETIGEAAAAKAATAYKSYYSKALPEGSEKSAAALKPGIGLSSRVPGSHQVDAERVPVRLNNKCGICAKSSDQHLLAKCDTCSKFYHLGCLDPPLTRMPKKTKQMGWQCSECDKESGSSEVGSVDADAPRKLRRSSKEREARAEESMEVVDVSVEESKKNKKRRRDKHRARYSPEPLTSQSTGKHHSRKRKRKSSDLPGEQDPPRQGIKLFIKSVPNSSGQANFIATPSSSNGPTFVPKTEEQETETSVNAELSPPKPKRKSVAPSDVQLTCDTCKLTGTSTIMVSCDECLKNFHFQCLDPPVKKSPKVRGYSWHCANCDPTETDSD